jgi:hypothetical protein
MKKLISALMAVGAMGTFGLQTANAGYIQTVDATTTRDWNQVVDTSRLPLSDLISRCNAVTGACSGSVTNFFGVTTNLNGLTWASTAQVEALFRSRGGFLTDQLINSSSVPWQARQITVDNAIGDGWIDTDSGSLDDGIFKTYLGNTTYLAGWTRDTFSSGATARHARVTFSELAGNDFLEIPALYDLDTTGSNTLIGAFLFRETSSVVEPPPPPPPTGTVPLPPTLAILGLGLIGLMRSRFVK